MLDLFHIPTSLGGADLQIFNTPSTVTNLQWNTWRKPRGKSMCNIICIGGGAGGGGGLTGTAASARGGGGGGGSSAISKVTVPLNLLPDVLYVQVGAGGLGVGSGGGVAGGGTLSYVAIFPNTTASNIIAVSGAAVPSGGVSGTAAGGGNGQAGGTVAAIANMPLAGLGIYVFIAGQIGANGGAHTGGVGQSSSIPVTGNPTMGGAGGAGVTAADFAGGGITAIAGSLLSEMRPALPAAGTFNGSSGVISWKPFFSFCGCGGSSANATAGGAGGDGAYGSGGSGGGGGTTGGKGGDGGCGIVIITSW